MTKRTICLISCHGGNFHFLRYVIFLQFLWAVDSLRLRLASVSFHILVVHAARIWRSHKQSGRRPWCIAQGLYDIATGGICQETLSLRFLTKHPGYGTATFQRCILASEGSLFVTRSRIGRKYSPGYIDQKFLTRHVSLDYHWTLEVLRTLCVCVCVCACACIFLQREPVTFRIFSKEPMIQRHFKKPLF